MTLKEFFKNDRYAAFSNAEIITIQEGYAKAKMTVQDMHLNGGDVCQGGAIFTLADLAFAAACNSSLVLSFSISSTISFHKSALLGDTLFAEAQVTFNHPKLPCAEVKITNQRGELIASFTGSSYRKKQALDVVGLE